MSRILTLGLVVAAVSAAAALGAAPPPGAQAAARPKLAVLVIFDQFRGDFPTRWRELFGADGINRLLTEGCWFSDCHFPYANTLTGPGHASLATGCTPDKHGIIQNDWWDRAAAATVYCAAQDRYARVPARAAARRGGRSGTPELLLAPTLADALKDASGGRGKVVALSIKDRGAVLLGGKRPDAVYWFDEGDFVTSTYYRDQVHDWVAALNAEKPADRWFGKDWTRLRPDLDYQKFSGPDDAEGEGTGIGQGRVFPHKMTGGLEKPARRYYDAVLTSPFGNELLFDLAKRAIVAEALGQRDAPDLLALSFSSNDLVGHAWGPDSQEVLDISLRSDRLVAELLQFLDEKVGKGNYVLGLSADHGVAPLPEVSRAKGIDAARFSALQVRDKAEAHLKERIAGGRSGRWIEALHNAEFYLNRRLIQSAGLKLEDVQDELAAFLRTQPCVLTTFTARQLESDMAAKDPLAQRVRRGYHAARSGDVLAVVKPYWYGGPYLTGTGHGSPHPYDTHVPFIVYGAGVRPGEREEAVTPLALPVLLGQAVGVELKSAQESAPAGVFR